MADQTTPAHDVFEGEIPKNLGKKSMSPIIKIAGLIALVGILGTAAIILESGDNFTVEPGIDITESLSGHLPSSGEDKQSPTSAPNLSETDEIALDLSEPEAQAAAELEALEYEGESSAITIVPPAEPVNYSEQNQSETFVDDDLRIEVTQLSSRIDEIEAMQTERINVVKSGIDLQSQGIDELNKLVKSLDALKWELEALKTTSVVQPLPTPTKSKTVNPQQSKSKTAEKSADKALELNLLGIDTWGGVRFAQIEYEGQIHLLATNESIGNWRIQTIAHNNVVVRNTEGESIELSI